MHVARGVDVRARLVDLAVNDEAGGVDVSMTAADSIALFVNPHHVRHLEHAEVYAIRIDPERVWFHGVCVDVGTVSTRSSYTITRPTYPGD